MIVNDLYVQRLSALPTKHNAPLVVYPNRMKPFSIAFKRLEPISWGNSEILQFSSVMQIEQLSSGNSAQFRRERSGGSTVPVIEQIFCEPVFERFDHVPILSEHDNQIKPTMEVEKPLA